MPHQSEKVPKEIPEELFGSLRGCLVEGDTEQRLRERRVRRRALALSIVLQCAALTLLVLVPLFGKGDRIVLGRVYVPIPPYGHPGSHPRSAAALTRSQSTNHGSRFVFHSPMNNLTSHPIEDPNPIEPSDLNSISNQSNVGPDCPWCVNIPGKDSGPRSPQPPTEAHRKPIILQRTQLDPALLIHRVEPVYPALAKQTHHEGRVELRAIIGTDGAIQSLQIVAGDPLFDRSALEAVQQWRYRPTILNGQPVEIDTYITVIYSMSH